MGIGPDQRSYMQKALTSAIDSYYGEQVPTLKGFVAQRRATYIAKLEERVKASELRAAIAEERETAGRAQGVVTRLTNERSAKQAELKAQHAQQLADLRAKQQKEETDLVAHYEPAMLEAKAKQEVTAAKRDAVERAAYFTALGVEDDARYLRNFSIDEAIRTRVDEFTEKNLMADEAGAAVQLRVNQEKLMGDAVWLAKDMKNLRELILGFINAGKLPPITVEAWLIENGIDLMPQ